MNKNKILFLDLCLLVLFTLSSSAKEPIYESGYLQDIQIQQGYRGSTVVGLTGGIGSGNSYNVFYPLVKVSGIT